MGEGVGVVRVEKGMVVHVEGQGQAVGLEGARQKIEMGQEGFAGVEAGSGVVAGVRGEVVFEGPAADAGAVGLKVQSAMQFTGTSAVGGRRLGREEFLEQGDDVLGPSGMVIAAGNAGRPKGGLPLGTGAEILAVELVEPGAGEPQFLSSSGGGEFISAITGQEMPDDGSGQTFDQL